MVIILFCRRWVSFGEKTSTRVQGMVHFLSSLVQLHPWNIDPLCCGSHRGGKTEEGQWWNQEVKYLFARPLRAYQTASLITPQFQWADRAENLLQSDKIVSLYFHFSEHTWNNVHQTTSAESSWKSWSSFREEGLTSKSWKPCFRNAGRHLDQRKEEENKDRL